MTLARLARIGGRELLQCIVDTTGRAEPNSVEVLESPDTALSRAATTALLGAQFRPRASRDGPCEC